MKARLCMLIEGYKKGNDIEWDIVSAFPDNIKEIQKQYAAINGNKILLLWTMLDGLSIWQIKTDDICVGGKLEHPKLPWEILSMNERCQLFPKIHDIIVKFVEN